MVDRPKPSVSPASQAPCTHHWLIENPNGETSRGVCNYCSASREFLNYVPFGQSQYRTRKDAASANG